MKRVAYVSLAVIAAILLATACAPSRNHDMSSEFVSKESGTYAGYLFWNLDSDVNELSKELLSIVNSDQVMPSVRFSKVEVISMNDKTREKAVRAFGIEKSPTLLVFDTEKLIWQTSDLRDLYKWADQRKEETSR